MNIPFKSYWNLLRDHIRPQKGRFTLLAILLFGSIGLRILAPQIMRAFIDDALAGEPLRILTWTALAFIGIALIQQGVAVAVKYLGENVAWSATNALRAELAEHALYLEAISAGAVFMGANTYIGNAPNFMVKAIAEEGGVKMPSFFGYIFRWTLPFLIPVFLLDTLLFRLM